MSRWESVAMAPADPILGITVAFRADTHPSKLNLGVGAYRDENGQPKVLDVVRKVEAALVADAKENKEYIPIEGLAEFCKVTASLLFGKDHAAIVEERIATVQSLSGTGAVRIAAEWVAQTNPEATVYVSNPTWGNHNSIFGKAKIKVSSYRYFDKKTKGVDFDGMMEDLKAAAPGSVMLFHTCAHNPTGADLTLQQWEIVAQLTQEKNFLCIFDTAYQGYATGDLDNDALAPRLFASKGIEIMVCQSYAKNMGLYGERIGALNVVTKSKKVAQCVLSQLKTIIRPMYSSPPSHGAKIVARILNDETLTAEWKVELKAMSQRIVDMRQQLLAALVQNGCPGTWDHITSQIGMFTYTGLTTAQVNLLTEKYHIYMTKDGRISMAGLSAATVPYLAEAMKDAVINVHE